MRLDRLKELALHLRDGKLGHKKFDFNLFNANQIGHSMSRGRCGSRGCAIGECPILWPKDWVFAYAGFPTLKDRSDDGYERLSIRAASDWFEIAMRDAVMLFMPSERPGRLPNDSSRQQVAAHILEFVGAHS